MYCKSPDKAVLEPSIILYLQVTTYTTDVEHVFILFLMF